MAIDIMHAFTHRPPALDFVLPGFVAGTVGALVAPGSTGKSFWALEAAMAIAAGFQDANLLGIKADEGDVVYLAGEDPTQALEMRIHAIGGHLNESARQAVAEHLAVESVMGKRFNVMDEKHADRLVEYSKGKRLIILDTLSRIHQMDENSNGEMAKLIGQLEYIAKQTGAGVLFLHHVSKNASKEKTGDQQTAARGASSLIDNSRWCGFLSKMSDYEAKVYNVSEAQMPYFLRFGISKQNYSEPFKDVWLKRVDGGVLLPADEELAAMMHGESMPPVPKKGFGHGKGKSGAPCTVGASANAYAAAKEGEDDADFF